MPTAVKICGITRAEDALVAVECGAAAVGFNFWPGSPRSCDFTVAAGIIAALPGIGLQSRRLRRRVAAPY